MHPLKNGAFINDVPLLPNNTKLLSQILKEQGYQTAYIGKWHLLGGNRDRGVPEGSYATVLIDSGIFDYSIYFDETSYSLLAIMYVKDDYDIDGLSQNKIVRKWWDYMSDIMETETDNSPVIYHLEEVFSLKKT